MLFCESLSEILCYLCHFPLITDRDASSYNKKGPLPQGVGGYWKELCWSPADDDQCKYPWSRYYQHITSTIANITIEAFSKNFLFDFFQYLCFFFLKVGIVIWFMLVISDYKLNINFVRLKLTLAIINFMNYDYKSRVGLYIRSVIMEFLLLDHFFVDLYKFLVFHILLDIVNMTSLKWWHSFIIHVC